MEKGQIIKCKVIGIQPYGVFVSVDQYNGLIHISEVSDRYVADINTIFKLDDIINAFILEVDEEEKKLQLSYKRALNIHPKVNQLIDVKIGFRSVEAKLEEWINERIKK